MAIPKTAFSSKPKTSEPRFVDKSEAQGLERKIRQRISELAYRLYEETGYQDGNAQQHWQQAESEVLGRGLEVRESGSWLAVNATISEVSAENVHIYVDPARVIVRAKKDVRAGKPELQVRDPTDLEIFMVADLKTEVDPSTASASFKDSKLSLMVKKRFPATGSEVLGGNAAK